MSLVCSGVVMQEAARSELSVKKDAESGARTQEGISK